MIKFFKKFNSVFYRLVISYSLLTIIIITAFGSTASKYFSNTFEKEISNLNLELLNHLSTSIDNSIINRVEKLSYDILSYNNGFNDVIYLFDHKPSGNHDKILNSMTILKSSITSLDIIDSVSIYYRNNDLIVSSYGIKYINENDISKKSPFDTAWIEIVEKDKFQKAWIDTRKIELLEKSVDTNANVITFVSAFPLQNTSNTNTKGLIAINVNENILYENIKSICPPKFGELLIVNEYGKIMSHSNKSKLYQDISNESFIKKISEFETGFFIMDHDLKRSVISYTTSKTNGWKYISIVPVTLYYKNSYILKNIIIYISLFFILVAIIITNIFTFKIYNPLRIIVETTKKILNIKNEANTYDESKIINLTINHLSEKVKNLTEIIDKNKDIILHNTLNNLIYGKFPSQEAIKDSLDFAGISFSCNQNIVFKIVFKRNTVNNLTLENKEYIKYNTVYQLNDYKSLHSKLFAFETFENEIALIFNYNNQNELDNVINHMLQIKKYTNDNFKISFDIGIGNVYKNLQQLTQSFIESEEALKYNYLYPEKSTYFYQDFSDRSLNKGFPHECFIEIAKFFRLNAHEHLQQSINECIQLLIGGKYSINYSMNLLKNIIITFETTLKEMNYSFEEFDQFDLIQEFEQIDNINDFTLWLNKLLNKIFCAIDGKRCIQSNEYIQKVKNYIDAHIEEDLSLESVANALYISSFYLSRIFKKETGLKFIDFMTKCKMQKAQELLSEKKLNINHVAAKLGYKNVSYFIKKYKEAYGKSPKQYRIEELGVD